MHRASDFSKLWIAFSVYNRSFSPMHSMQCQLSLLYSSLWTVAMHPRGRQTEQTLYADDLDFYEAYYKHFY